MLFSCPPCLTAGHFLLGDTSRALITIYAQEAKGMELKEVFAALEAATDGAALVQAVKDELAKIRKEAADARVAKNKAEGDLVALKT